MAGPFTFGKVESLNSSVMGWSRSLNSETAFKESSNDFSSTVGRKWIQKEFLSSSFGKWFPTFNSKEFLSFASCPAWDKFKSITFHFSNCIFIFKLLREDCFLFRYCCH